MESRNLQASVVIPNLHSPHLGDVLQALRAQSVEPIEVIVVGQDRYGFAQDDGRIKLIATPQPVPQAVARNLGAMQATGDVLCFLDADCVPMNNWLERLLAHHCDGQQVVGGSIVLEPQPYWQQCDNIAHFASLSNFSRAGQRAYLLTGNFSIRTSMFGEIGGFDERFRYLEDTELSFRLRKRGYKLYFAPDAVVSHYNTERNSASEVWKHSYKYGLRWASVVQQHPEIVGPSLGLKMSQASRLLGWASAPVMVLRELLHVYSQSPRMLTQYGATIPGVFWSRLGWHAGIIDDCTRARTNAHAR